MTIRVNYEGRPGKIKAEFSRAGDDVYNLYSDSAANTVLATCDTFEEAEQAKRAFENVLAPRFTRDEAIAIVKDALNPSLPKTGRKCIPDAMRKGALLALEALAAAGVFSDCGPEQCFSSESCARSMADKLDAAGIR